MTIKQFIETAVKGGYVLGGMDAPRTKKDGHAYKHQILLDPLAWKAVGKVEGWPLAGLPVVGDYTNKMHDMVDALREGRSIEEFLATL